MTKVEVGTKLKEISKELNSTISLCQKENTVEEFLNKIYDLRLKLVKLYESASDVYKENPKLNRVHKSLYEEVLKNICRYGNLSETESEIN